MHGELNGDEIQPKKIAKIFSEDNGPISTLEAHFSMFDRRLFSPRFAQENLFFLQLTVEFIEQQPMLFGPGKNIHDDESSAVYAKTSSQKACFGFKFIADITSSSGGGGGGPSPLPSPEAVSGMRPPLHNPSPTSGRGMFTFIALNHSHVFYPGSGMGSFMATNRQQPSPVPTNMFAVGATRETTEPADVDESLSGAPSADNRRQPNARLVTAGISA